MSASPGLFVTGTDTGVGKTRVAAAIARAWRPRGGGSASSSRWRRGRLARATPGIARTPRR